MLLSKNASCVATSRSWEYKRSSLMQRRHSLFLLFLLSLFLLSLVLLALCLPPFSLRHISDPIDLCPLQLSAPYNIYVTCARSKCMQDINACVAYTCAEKAQPSQSFLPSFA